MSHRRLAMSLVLIVVSAGLVTACSDDNPLPGGPSVGVVRVEIQGPASIAPGQSAQYAAIGIRSDGTTLALPYDTWASTDSSLVQVTSSGIATAQSHTGEVRLSVTAAMSASKEVMVLPANTFRLVGSVTDTQGVGIPDARVEVIGGPSATTGSNGAYRLYGVPPEADVRVTKGRYPTVEQQIQLSTHTSFNFRMPVNSTAVAAVAGTLDVTQTGTVFVFTVELTESKGVAATVTDAWVNLDSGWSGQCSFDVARLGQTRVPANGTLALNPLTCGSDGTTAVAELSIGLTDDNGHELQVAFSRVVKR